MKLPTLRRLSILANIITQIQGVATALGLTPYGISQRIVAGAKEPTPQQRMAAEKRWQTWLKGEGLRTMVKLEEDLAELGKEIVIRDKEQFNESQ